MEDWRKYVTNADDPRNIRKTPTRAASAGSTALGATPSNATPNKLNSFPKAWLYFNYFLVGLCCLSLIFGLVETIHLCVAGNLVDDSFLTTIIESACLLFIYPGIALVWIYALLTTGSGFQGGLNIGIVAYSMIASAILGIGLIINAIIAHIAKRRYCHNPADYRLATKNARLALISPIFVSIMLILLLLVL